MSADLPARSAARLLRAKAADLEARCLDLDAEHWSEVDYLRADVALVAGLLAALLERVEAERLGST